MERHPSGGIVPAMVPLVRCLKAGGGWVNDGKGPLYRVGKEVSRIWNAGYELVRQVEKNRGGEEVRW